MKAPSEEAVKLAEMVEQFFRPTEALKTTRGQLESALRQILVLGVSLIPEPLK